MNFKLFLFFFQNPLNKKYKNIQKPFPRIPCDVPLEGIFSSTANSDGDEVRNQDSPNFIASESGETTNRK